jgi:hypothetical protein
VTDIVNANVRILDGAGSEVLNLGAGGYGVGPVTFDGFTWRNTRATSPVMDGWVLTQAVKDGGVLTFTVHVEGSSWAQQETRRLALEAALSQFVYGVEVSAEGVTEVYRADPGDLTRGTLVASDVAACAKTYGVSVPCQPNPTVTGA